MNFFFSRYRPRYVRSLVYMMQASEYRVLDFLKWFWRVEDFSHVEGRKTLVETRKSTLLLVAGYFLFFFLCVSSISILFNGVVGPRFFSFFILVLSIPYLVAYGMTLILFVFNLLQRPVEYVIMRKAKQTLANHKGMKIAIAGSFGKTSMREILKTVLAAGKRVAAPPRSYNTPLGISTFVKKLKGDEEVLIFELGEYYPGDIKRISELVQPDRGVITGVNEAHLEKFKDLERTRRTIFELSDYLGGKPLYINGENDLARTHARAGHILYGRAGAGGVQIEEPITGLSGTSFVLHAGSRAMHVRSRLLGLHHIGPLAVAADIAFGLGLSAEQVEKGIANTKPFEHRLEPITDAQGVTTLDDSYNGNPDGVRALILFLSSLRGIRRWYVTPGLVEMGARREEVHREIGRQLARAGIEKVVLIRNSVTPFIARGLEEAHYSGEVMWFERALDAFAALPNLTVKGDVVLLQNDWPDQYV